MPTEDEGRPQPRFTAGLISDLALGASSLGSSPGASTGKKPVGRPVAGVLPLAGFALLAAAVISTLHLTGLLGSGVDNGLREPPSGPASRQ